MAAVLLCPDAAAWPVGYVKCPVWDMALGTASIDRYQPRHLSTDTSRPRAGPGPPPAPGIHDTDYWKNITKTLQKRIIFGQNITKTLQKRVKTARNVTETYQKRYISGRFVSKTLQIPLHRPLRRVASVGIGLAAGAAHQHHPAPLA